MQKKSPDDPLSSPNLNKTPIDAGATRPLGDNENGTRVGFSKGKEAGEGAQVFQTSTMRAPAKESKKVIKELQQRLHKLEKHSCEQGACGLS